MRHPRPAHGASCHRHVNFSVPFVVVRVWSAAAAVPSEVGAHIYPHPAPFNDSLRVRAHAFRRGRTLPLHARGALHFPAPPLPVHACSLSHTAITSLNSPQVLSLPIEDVLVLDVDDGRVTVAGAAVTLQNPLLQPLPGQHWSRLADAVYAMLDAYSGSEAVGYPGYALVVWDVYDVCDACFTTRLPPQVLAICGAFFEFFMAVMGSYGKHMKQETHGKVMDFDSFTRTQSPDMQPFVSALRHVQMCVNPSQQNQFSLMYF